MDRLLNVVSKLKILDERKSPFCDSIKEMIAYSDMHVTLFAFDNTIFGC